MASAFPDPLIASNEDSHARNSTLVVRKVNVHGHRTSIRLEQQIWDMLAEICRREFCTIEDVCSSLTKAGHGPLASLLYGFILDYFVRASTEEGHNRAGHGRGMFLAHRTAGDAFHEG